MRFLPTGAVLLPLLIAACGGTPTGPAPVCTVTAVTISGAPATLQVGSTATLAAMVTSHDCDPVPAVTWSVTPTASASISATGVLLATAPGSITVTATAGGVQGAATVMVVPEPAAEVTLEVDSLVLRIEGAWMIPATARDGSGATMPDAPIAWTSLDSTIARVDAAGTITGVAVGTARIVASSGSGADTALVHVLAPRLGVLYLSPESRTGTYTPSAGNAWNSAGGTPSVSHDANGAYQVGIGLTTSPPFATSTAFLGAGVLPADGTCRIDTFNAFTIRYRCFNRDGSGADGRAHSVMLGNATFRGRTAQAWFNNQSAQPVSADPRWRHNASGGDITSVRVDRGHYTVRFAGLGRRTMSDREAVFVSAYGSGTPATCQVGSWNSVGTDLEADVWCFTLEGQPTDQAFSILVADRNRVGATLGYAVADQPATAAYVPAVGTVQPSGSARIARQGPGSYAVWFTNHYVQDDQVEVYLVTALGPTPARCRTTAWDATSTPGGEAVVGVECRAPDGTPTDHQFVIIAIH